MLNHQLASAVNGASMPQAQIQAQAQASKAGPGTKTGGGGAGKGSARDQQTIKALRKQVADLQEVRDSGFVL